MSSPNPDIRVPLSSPAEQVFPKLTPEQLAPGAARGRRRPTTSGEILASAGRQAESFFAVTAGSLELVQHSKDGENVVAVLRPGQLTGEVNLLSGRQMLVDHRIGEAGEVIDVKRDDLVALIQTDSGLSDIFMRAFILRRVAVPGSPDRGQPRRDLSAANRDHGARRGQPPRARDLAQQSNREVTTPDIRHVFSMTGAIPSTRWLDHCVALDADGFIKTGPNLSQEDLAAAHGPLARPPYLLETSLPGVFAVGDVRCGNVKRVASAVGEGSIAVTFVHQVLRE